MKFSAAPIFAVAAVALLALTGTSHAQTNLYSSLTLPAPAQTGVVSYLELLNPANGTTGTGAAGPGTYTVTGLELGLNFNTGDNDQGVVIYFYTGVNTSPTATDALATATYLTGINGTLSAPGAAGNFTFTFTLNTPLVLTTPDGTLGVEFQLTDSDFANYSDDMNGRFSAVAPTVGTSPGYVWNDANLDGSYSGSEQTKFGQTGAYVRFSLGGSFAAATVPEPGTWAMMLGGMGLLGVGARFRRSRKA